jgi:signal transduction histidine kinase
MRVVSVEWGGSSALLATLRDITERKKVAAALRFLSEAGGTLAGSLDVETTLESVSRLALEHLATWCILDLVEAEGVRRIAKHLTKRELAEQLSGRYALGSYQTSGVARVIHTGWQEVYLNPSAAEVEALALTAERVEVVRQLGCRAALIVPMIARGRAIGAITFVSCEGLHTYEQEEQALAQNLADRAGLAMDNARLYDEAQEALKRRDEFLAVLAHELRNPLAPIVTAAQVMRLQGGMSASQQRQQAIIERQSQHLTHLLDDLLDLSRVTHGKIDLRMEPVDLAVVVSDALQVIRGIVEEKKHQLTIELDPMPMVVFGDATRLAQILENLLVNAARYTDEGGRIRLMTRQENEDAILCVEDNGQGISDEMVHRIFEPFTRGALAPHGAREQTEQTAASGGLGIGLALVKRLVELHSGKVEVRSRSKEGSQFEVRLPLIQAKVQAQTGGPLRSYTPRRILLIEDNEDGREMLADLLRLWGHKVEGVGDGKQGLQRLLQWKPDSALVDIGLPGVDGYSLAQKVREQKECDKVQLVALTGYGMPEDRSRALRAGFDEHLVKPVDLEELAKLLERGRRG